MGNKVNSQNSLSDSDGFEGNHCNHFVGLSY